MRVAMPQKTPCLPSLGAPLALAGAGILFLYSPSLPCPSAPLVLYCRLVSVGLAVNMLWGFLANVLLWTARRTHAQALAYGVVRVWGVGAALGAPHSSSSSSPPQLWLSGASLVGLWERAGFVVASGGLIVVQAHVMGGAVPGDGGAAGMPAFGRAWLQHPGAGDHLSSAAIDALPTFVLCAASAAPPLRATTAGTKPHGEAADGGGTGRGQASGGGTSDSSNSDTGVSGRMPHAADASPATGAAAAGAEDAAGGGSGVRADLPAALFESPLAHGFPAGVVPDTACAVCQCDYEAGDTLRPLPCGHAFHRACADTWLAMQATCPICRARVVGAAVAAPPLAGQQLAAPRGVGHGPPGHAHGDRVIVIAMAPQQLPALLQPGDTQPVPLEVDARAPAIRYV